jgi:hypothetical protein
MDVASMYPCLPPPPTMSLSSVVSGLVRAQMGAAVAPSVDDKDLDRHVADLILQEAKQKAQRYAQLGVSAYVAECVPRAFCVRNEADGEGVGARTRARRRTSAS